jgi:hypothetical protein
MHYEKAKYGKAEGAMAPRRRRALARCLVIVAVLVGRASSHGAAGDADALCPGVVYPGAGVELGDDDPLCVRVPRVAGRKVVAQVLPCARG